MPKQTSAKPLNHRVNSLEAEQMMGRGAPIRWPGGGAGSGGGTVDITGTTTGPWTIAEYEPITGEIIRTFDRGRRRDSTTASTFDHDIIMGADGYLYAGGTGSMPRINRHDGGVTKWDPDTGERIWDFFDSTTVAEISGPTSASAADHALAMDVDGNIWSGGSTVSGNSPVVIDPATGLQLGAGNGSGTTRRSVWPLSTGGAITVPGQGGADTVSAWDSTPAETAGISTSYAEVLVVNDRVYAITTARTAIHILDTSLSVIDSRSAPGVATYAGMTTDGTTVWTATNTESPIKYRAYDATSLATEITNANRTIGTIHTFHYRNGFLYLSLNSGAMRRIHPTTLAETWITTGTTFNPFWRPHVGIGSDFVVIQSGGGTGTIYCLEASTGATRWQDVCATVSSSPGGSVLVTDDDRVFVGSIRRGP